MFQSFLCTALTVALLVTATARGQSAPEYPPASEIRHAESVVFITDLNRPYPTLPFLQTVRLRPEFQVHCYVEGRTSPGALRTRDDPFHWRLEVLGLNAHLPWATGFPNDYWLSYQKKEILPFWGELYRLEYDPGMGDGAMIRVTDFAPAEVRPQTWSHIISLVELERDFLWNDEESSKVRLEALFGRVKLLSIQEDDERGGELCADLWIRPALRRGAAEYLRIEPEPFEVRVHPGEILATPDQCYRVINIVPEQELYDGDESVGVLAGWIELDPEPLPPPEDPAVAPGEETEGE